MKQYYWHIGIFAALVLFAGCGKSPTSPNPSGSVPAAPKSASPANGATVQATSIILSWTASPGANTYNVQVATVSTFATTILDQSGITATQYDLTSLSGSTTYYWRESAENGAGTSAWSGVYSFTTTAVNNSLSAPALVSPANGAIGQATSLILTWGAVTNATSYSVQVSTVSTFASVVSSQTGLTALSASVSGLANSTTYYWEVKATNASSTSAWSSIWSFTTAAKANMLSAPTLVAPINGATGLAKSLTLSWDGVTSAISYSVLVSTASTFSSTVVNQTGITAVSEPISGLANITTYYWKVSAKNAGATSVWSSIWSFTTAAATTAMIMRQIPGGTFQMGSTNATMEAEDYSNEEPIHSVTVSAFYMDTTDVTQADYQALMGVNPSWFDTGALAPRRPVEQVTWFDAVLYCNARSKRDGYDTVYSFNSITGTAGNGCSNLGNLSMDFTQHGYRLPTEAEWEYACRAGSTTDYYWGQSYPPLTAADTAEINDHVWWWKNSSSRTQLVATKPANGVSVLLTHLFSDRLIYDI